MAKQFVGNEQHAREAIARFISSYGILQTLQHVIELVERDKQNCECEVEYLKREIEGEYRYPHELGPLRKDLKVSTKDAMTLTEQHVLLKQIIKTLSKTNIYGEK